jgi:hypothetical protein
MSRSVPSRVPVPIGGFRSKPLLFLVSAVLTILLQGCAAGPGTPLPQPSTLESEIYAIFSGSDTRAMAQMGQRLERERPRLSPELVGRMLSFLTSAPPQDSPVIMLRPMLFRTVAVVVGPDSRPYLEDCIASSMKFSDLCSSTVAELASAPR